MRSGPLLLVPAFLVALLWAVAPPAHGQPAPTATAEAPMLADAVKAGQLPPLAERAPSVPKVEVPLTGDQVIGRYGGDLTTLMARARDSRIVYVMAYARLVRWTPTLTLEPDILERVEVANGEREFTLHLRPGHKWSDGKPFTTEDFRYWWEDVAGNTTLQPFGPPAEILIDREAPKVEILSPTVVRYAWSKPNPYFLPSLAGARPTQIFAPAHFLRNFHEKYTPADVLRQRVQAAGARNWAQLHNRLDSDYNFDNPDGPTLQPWIPTTAPPADRFVYARNPYFHRIDPDGRQLPYIDRWIMQVADSRLVPAKTGAGETDLQARYLRFDNYTFLREAQQRNNFDVRLWKNGSGAHLTLYPNLNANDPVWRGLMRDVRFRRALSIAINRDEINQVVYFGLASPSQNTVLPESPLFKEDYRTAWTKFDPREANRLLDEIGLTKKDRAGTRLLPDGRPLEIIVETAGESTEETDVLQLIGDSWRRAGIKLFSRPSQLEVFRNRIYAGEAMMVISKGIDNGVPTPNMPPTELVPVDQTQYHWPKWGQHHQTRGGAGEAPDLAEGRQLMSLRAAWEDASDEAGRRAAWDGILRIHADNVFTIGIVAGVQQPVVVRRTLKNVPQKALFNFDPGAFFGMYQPDLFYFEPRG